MAGGNATIFNNLRDTIGARDDVDSSWIPVHLGWHHNPLIPDAFRNSRVTKLGIRAFEQNGTRFDAAYFFQHTIVTSLWSFRRRVPYVLGMDGTPSWYLREGLFYAHDEFNPGHLLARVKQKITKSIYSGAFHLLPLSHGVKQSLIDDYGVPEERITVVPPAINLNMWTRPEPGVKTAADRPLKVLFVGGEFLRKGGDLMVTIANSPEFRDVEFHFVTQEYQGGTAPNIFVYSKLERNSDVLRSLYAGADVFVLPTRADSHSIASLEAMASELPVITTRVGGIVDIVVEGETGFFVKTGDVDSLVDRLRTLLHNPELRRQMGIKGRARVEERFNLERIADFTVDILSQAARSKPRGLRKMVPTL